MGVSSCQRPADADAGDQPTPLMVFLLRCSKPQLQMGTSHFEFSMTCGVQGVVLVYSFHITGKPPSPHGCGLIDVCQVWRLARSGVYRRRAPARSTPPDCACDPPAARVGAS